MKKSQKKVFVEREGDSLTIYPFEPIYDQVSEFRKMQTKTIPEQDLFYLAKAKKHKYISNEVTCVLYPFLAGENKVQDTLSAEEIGYRTVDTDFDFCIMNKYSPSKTHVFMQDNSYSLKTYSHLLDCYLNGGMNGGAYDGQPFRVALPECLGGQTKNFLSFGTYVGPTWETKPYAIMGGILQLTDLEYLEQLLRCNKIKLLSKRATVPQVERLLRLFSFGRPEHIDINKLVSSEIMINRLNSLLYGDKIDGGSVASDYAEQAEIDSPIIEQVEAYVLRKK